MAIQYVTALVIALPSLANAQPVAEDEKFDVASIRPSRSDTNPPAIRFMPGGGLVATNVTLTLLIQIAYDIRPDQLSAGPPWADSAQFDINAKGPIENLLLAPETDRKRITSMRLRALLDERFKLIVQRRSKDRSGYALVVAKNGPKFTPSVSSERGRLRQTGIARVTGEGAKMETLAKLLSVRLGEDVVDKTGLTDHYDFTLSWIPEPETGSPALSTPVYTPGPSIFAALEEQLGLRLEPQKIAAEFLTIEHAEKPTDN
jgi:uncharacterized protein (TIGR03435 family)